MFQLCTERKSQKQTFSYSFRLNLFEVENLKHEPPNGCSPGAKAFILDKYLQVLMFDEREFSLHQRLIEIERYVLLMLYRIGFFGAWDPWDT